jgi:hypothetical protein
LQRSKTGGAEGKRAAWANSHTHDPDREAAAAESETEQFVVGITIAPAGEFVEGDYVALQV